jgi:hypothetical protein
MKCGAEPIEVSPHIPNTMIVKPPKVQGLIIGSILFLLSLGGIVFGILHLAAGEIGPLLGLWTTIVILGIPILLLVGYRLYGLLTAHYVLDRDGFYLSWGFASEKIPLSAIENIMDGEVIGSRYGPSPGFWWPGCIVGRRGVEGLGEVEFFATTTAKDQVIIPLENRSLAISPPDAGAFQQAFMDFVRLGSLEEISTNSYRPDFFSARLWADRIARFLILAGLVLVLSLLAYLAFRIVDLPDQVPFGFDLLGQPDTFVPPSQLILLPIVGGFFWFLDLMIGVWLFRLDRDRKISYAIWFVGVVLSVLLWGAVIHLLQAV